MVELAATTPFAGRLPIRIGRIALDAADMGQMSSIAPYAARGAACAACLQETHGLTFPEPNTMAEAGAARILWFGRDLALLTGVPPDPALAEHAAVTDQSDAWAAVTLEGPGAEAVLARLVPVDLGPRAFPAGRTCRTLVGHMAGSVSRLAPERFLILVFRSMAGTLLHDLQEAMEAVAARG